VADHPVKVPAELVKEWMANAKGLDFPDEWGIYVAAKAAQWGADEQLYEVNDWIRYSGSYPKTDIRWELDILQLDRLGRELWQAMRPKPPSLAEQGIAVVRQLKNLGSAVDLEGEETKRELNVLEEALNRLAELEAQQ
jgi:hypothetical protein